MLPCLPQYRAPKIANTMLGSIDSMDTMVPNWMLPIRMPNIIVEMMAWLLTCWASLSATADRVYSWKGRLVRRKWNISFRPTSSPPAVMPSKFSGLSTGVRPMQAISVSTQATATYTRQVRDSISRVYWLPNMGRITMVETRDSAMGKA